MNQEIDYQVHKLNIKHNLQEAANASKWVRNPQTQDEAKNTNQASIGKSMLTMAQTLINIIK